MPNSGTCVQTVFKQHQTVRYVNVAVFEQFSNTCQTVPNMFDKCSNMFKHLPTRGKHVQTYKHQSTNKPDTYNSHLSTLNMAGEDQCALNHDGTLKDPSEITWYESEGDDQPIGTITTPWVAGK